MKRYIILSLLILSVSVLSANTYSVGPGEPYATIQAAVNDAYLHQQQDPNALDDISILGNGNGYFESVNLLGLNLNIFGSGNPVIKGSSSNSIIFDASNCKQLYISELTIDGNQNLSNLTGVKIFSSSSATQTAEIYNCRIKNLKKGIHIKNYPYTTILNNDLTYNESAIYINQNNSTSYQTRILSNRINNNTRGIDIYAAHTLSIDYDEIKSNDIGIIFDDGYYQYAFLESSTIINNGIGINFSTYYNSDISVSNSIIYFNTNNLIDTGSNTTITYSDIEGGFTGTGNINADPVFCMNSDYKYHLEEPSPCIDAGDPNTSGGDVRIDMGCYESTTDIKPMQGNGHYNWESFPRLYITDQNNNEIQNNGENYDAPTLLNNTAPGFSDLKLFLANNQFAVLHYDLINFWTPSVYDINSEKGYKIKITDNTNFILPEEGTRLPYNHTIHLNAGENWIGYWIPGSQPWDAALGQYKDRFTQIKAENWTMTKTALGWIGPSNAKCTYGEAYIVYVDSHNYPNGFDFHWTHLTVGGSRFSKATTENFSYEEKADYEVIDIQSIEDDENIDEIGAFVNGVCVGASKVTEYPIQILAYTDNANRGGDDNSLYFEVVSGRGVKKKINDIYEYNNKTGEYEKTALMIRTAREHLITLGKNDYSEHIVETNILLNNYPNPFNPETTISFTLPKDEFAKIEIYNIKGQKVKTLINGKYAKGIQTATWKGLNDNGKKVASGIYMYKLITKDKTITQKMLMLK